MPRWVEVAASDAVPDEAMVCAQAEDTRLILIRLDGGLFAYENRCPHEDARLSDGELDPDDGVLICYRHLWEFEIRTGQHVSRVPSKERNLTVFPVRETGGVIEVDLDGAHKPEPET